MLAAMPGPVLGRTEPRPSAMTVHGRRSPMSRRPPSPGRRQNSLTQAPSGEQQRAIERLANYPQRMERLRRLWIDVNVGNRGSPGPGNRSRSPSAGRAATGGLTANRGSRGRASSREPNRRHTVPQRGAHQGPLTQAQIRELMSRELTPEDYELLSLLDEGVKKAKTMNPEAAAALPRAPGTDWVNEECRICLCALEEDEDVRMLPQCRHLFHAPCAERWLTSSKATCPLCGQEEKQQEKVLEVFRKFDANRDGLFDVNEMKLVLQVLDPTAWTASQVATLFEHMDANSDGKINTEEFVNWIFDGSGDGQQDRLRQTMNI